MDKADTKQILEKYKIIAVVGLSKDPKKDSYTVAEYLQKQGYHIIPINPTADRILGQKTYKTLLDVSLDIQKTIEVVDIFRPSNDVPPIVDQAIQLRRYHGNPKVIWMQLGIINLQAAQKAQKEGLIVIMDKCIMKEHHSLFGENDPEVERINAKKMHEMTKKSGSEKSSTPIIVTDSDFDETVKRFPLIVVDCWASWCGPCRMIAPVIEELAKDHAGEIVFGKLNVDENPETAARFNVMSIPTLLIMKNGAEIDRMVGAAPKLMIENRLKKHM